MPTDNRATRAARALRNRVANEVHLSTQLAQLREQVAQQQNQVAQLQHELGQLKASVHTLTGGTSPAMAVRKGPMRKPLTPQIEQTIKGVREERISFIGAEHLRSLAWAVQQLDSQGGEGDILETGTAMGGSAIVIAAAKAKERPLRAYDVFGMIPPPTDRDGADVHERYATIKAGNAKGMADEDVYYGYHNDLIGEVTASFERHGVPIADNNVELVQGLFEDTVVVDGPVALAHLDGDWYESTMVCLKRIVPHLSRGGRLVIDDYDAWSGCRIAIDEYFTGRPGFEFERRGRLHIIKS